MKKSPIETRLEVARGFESQAATLEAFAKRFNLVDYAQRLAALKLRRRALQFRGVTEKDLKGAEAQAE